MYEIYRNMYNLIRWIVTSFNNRKLGYSRTGNSCAELQTNYHHFYTFEIQLTQNTTFTAFLLALEYHTANTVAYYHNTIVNSSIYLVIDCRDGSYIWKAQVSPVHCWHRVVCTYTTNLLGHVSDTVLSLPFA